MYRAQVGGRCSLQFINSNRKTQNTVQEDDLEEWLREWLYPSLSQAPQDPDCAPTYCHQPPPLNLEGSSYRIQVEFPFRLFSNCGQDSIARPVIGKHGIPCLPGSGVKGVFRRACENPAQVKKYCGDRNDLIPGTSGLRFHAAYPIGNWGNRILDVVHPQENYQIGGPRKGHESAHPLISLYKPQLVFEFSAPDPSTIDWSEVEAILRRAIALGIGGKTSVSYGTGGHLPGQKATAPNFGRSHRQFRFSGDAISPKLLTGESEFRPNLFKATLRSHARRLLAGAVGATGPTKKTAARTSPMQQEVDRLFGHTDAPGVVQVVWQPTQIPDDERNQGVYHATGILHLGIDENHPQAKDGDMAFTLKLLRFAYLMGGFGKSWRRVWHHTFYPSYYRQSNYPQSKTKFPIGCHWVSEDVEPVADKDELQDFLQTLHQDCCDRLGTRKPHPESWRESWHPQRVAVYCRPNDNKSDAVIRLFHDDIFKTTPAIGGKGPGDERPKKVSSVWHRMVPISAGGHLEVVTVFHGDRTPWHRQRENQLQLWTQQLVENGLELSWGTSP
jgi:CRISPR-associated protein Cmr6